MRAAGRVGDGDAEGSREEDSRTEEPYLESDRGGAAASYSSVAEEADGVSTAEDSAEDREGTSDAEPREDSDGEAKTFASLAIQGYLRLWQRGSPFTSVPTLKRKLPDKIASDCQHSS